MTPQEYRQILSAGQRRSKYRAIPIVVDGVRFASKREAHLFQELRVRERAGEISDLKAHPSWELIVGGQKIGRYTADASYIERGKLHVVDVKSPATAKTEAFKLRCRLMLACHNINVEVVL